MTSAVETTAARVAELLAELGEAFQRHGEAGFYAKRGSAIVGIRVLPWEEPADGVSDGAGGDALVLIEAGVVEGATLTVDLLSQLLEFNHGSTFGAFGVSPGDGTITVHHSLLGSAVTRDSLIPAVLEVARIADDWDDVIVEQAGGATAVDRLQEATRPRPRPTIEPAPRGEA